MNEFLRVISQSSRWHRCGRRFLQMKVARLLSAQNEGFMNIGRLERVVTCV